MALHPRELRPQGGGEGPGQHGLADARDVLNEQVASGERGHGRGQERILAAEHDQLEVAQQGLTERDGRVDVTDACVESAHSVTAVCWAMGTHTTGAWLPPGSSHLVRRHERGHREPAGPTFVDPLSSAATTASTAQAPTPSPGAADAPPMF